MREIELLLALIESGDLFQHPKLDGDAISRILDVRDGAEFESQWMKAFRDLEAHKSVCSMTSQMECLVTAVRQAAYLQAFNCWKSSDLAACISDDFGLIGDALVTRWSDAWINWLLQTYLQGEVPSKSISGDPSTLAEQVTNWGREF